MKHVEPSALRLLPLPIFRQASNWFDRSQAALLDALPCRKGCSRCCLGTFPITRLDAEELQRALATLPSDVRAGMEMRAREQIAAMEAHSPDLRQSIGLDDWQDRAIDELVETFAALPCPALQPDGSCGVYPFRPLTCRTMGIPTEDTGVAQGACEVQTALPIRRLSRSLREEEELLAQAEARTLAQWQRATGTQGEELLLPYGFLTERLRR
jgi:Fe-S-cluster containining protein